MKKLNLSLLILLLSISMIGFTGCKDPEPAHEHTFSDSWSKDATHHWHAATCGHTTEVSEKAAHSFGDWITTKEATEEAEGSRERSCTVCGYTATEAIEKLAHTHKFATDWTKDETNHWYAATCEHTTEVSGKAAHSFGNWTTTKEATEEAEDSRERSCTVCEYKVTEVIEKLAHTHKFATDWTKDETNHWHATTCGHTTEVSEKAAHSFGDWITTKEATEEAEGSKERTCTVCEYKVTEVIEKLAHTHKFATDWTKDETNHWHAATCGHTTEVSEKAAHSFGDWTTTKEPTEEAEGSKERTCTVCGYTATETIEKLAHTHKFATDWTKDENHHWHAATCEHTTEVSGKAAHIFGDWTVTKEATEEAEGSRERSCTVCEYTATEVIEKLAHTHKFATDWTKDATHHWHASTCGHDVTDSKAEHSFVNEVCTICEYSRIPEGFVYVKGTTITGTETWTPSSEVFVSGRKLTIPNLLVSDHEVTRGEYKAVMGSDPSTADAYDKNGNKLTGEDVLNNPVNYVNWYDALVYCNKLSIKENLTPCYTINSSTDPDAWGAVPTSSNSTWNKATCNFKANGYRLPTEAEWEWLARGGEAYTYAGSNTVGDVAWYDTTGTREVKTKAPNGYGLYDMSGNVWEWCLDWYGSISDSTASDGATSSTNRVQRGGHWSSSDGKFFKVAYRYGTSPYNRNNLYGFRVVRSAN